ncbi:MAG: ATP-binding cassette domain-containing protein [Deltaproteobacteria bacterium]|nr:ATP-binding cassette domain-containing protein [Deltaproteobacteria bacterium]
MSKKPLLEIRELKTWYPIRRGVLNRTRGYIKAVDGVSLTLEKGQTLGLVGESGCGKTSLGRTLAGLEQAREGKMLFHGEPLPGINRPRKWRKRIQMIFQDPFSSLNPRMTAMDIITEGLEEHGMLKGTREEAAANLLSQVGMDKEAMYRYPHEFSGGQRQRLSVARAISLHPELVVCDEAVSALDVSVQAQVIKLLLRLQAELSLSYLFISHDLAVVSAVAKDTAVMYLGKIVETGPTKEVLNNPRHPYTRALLSAVPRPGREKRERIVLPGEPPSPANPPPGCGFHPRCPQAMDVCRTTTPAGRQQGAGRVWCHLYG